MEPYYSTTIKYYTNGRSIPNSRIFKDWHKQKLSLKVELDKVRDENTDSHTPWTYLAAKHGYSPVTEWLIKEEHKPDECTVGVALEFNQIDILK